MNAELLILQGRIWGKNAEIFLCSGKMMQMGKHRPFLSPENQASDFNDSWEGQEWGGSSMSSCDVDFMGKLFSLLLPSCKVKVLKGCLQPALPSPWCGVLWDPQRGSAPGMLSTIIIFLIIRRHPGNYRSMSFLSVPAKLIVKLIKDWLVQCSAKYNMRGSIQYGFWKRKLCLFELQGGFVVLVFF